MQIEGVSDGQTGGAESTLSRNQTRAMNGERLLGTSDLSVTHSLICVTSILTRHECRFAFVAHFSPNVPFVDEMVS